MIAIIDYGMGNLRSVHKALERLGLEARVTSEKRDVANASGVVLPGVGAFRDCMLNLEKHDLIGAILGAIDGGKPFLGICLGLQALFTQSEEFGIHPGLDVFKGKVTRFPDDMPDPEAGPDEEHYLKVPHMGWNKVSIKSDATVLSGIEEGSYFYFVHSFHVAPEDKSIIATSTEYGIEFASSVARDNVFACQFHPEKSQNLGLRLLRNFGEMVNGS